MTTTPPKSAEEQAREIADDVRDGLLTSDALEERIAAALRFREEERAAHPDDFRVLEFQCARLVSERDALKAELEKARAEAEALENDGWQDRYRRKRDQVIRFCKRLDQSEYDLAEARRDFGRMSEAGRKAAKERDEARAETERYKALFESAKTEDYRVACGPLLAQVEYMERTAERALEAEEASRAQVAVLAKALELLTSNTRLAMIPDPQAEANIQKALQALTSLPAMARAWVEERERMREALEYIKKIAGTKREDEWPHLLAVDIPHAVDEALAPSTPRSGEEGGANALG